MGQIFDRKVNNAITTDATPFPVPPYVIPPNSVATFTLEVRALHVASGDAAFFRIVGGFKRVGSGDAAVITSNPGNPQGPALSQLLTDLDGGSKDSGAAGWDATMALVGTGLVTTLQGDDGREIEWNTLLEINQFAPLG